MATANFPACPACLQTLIDKTPMKFWWNWDTHPKIDMDGFSQAQKQAAAEMYVPMIWGTGTPDDDYAFLNDTSGSVMGFNEPGELAQRAPLTRRGQPRARRHRRPPLPAPQTSTAPPATGPGTPPRTAAASVSTAPPRHRAGSRSSTPAPGARRSPTGPSSGSGQ